MMAREKKKEAKRRNKESQMVEVRENGERQPTTSEKERRQRLEWLRQFYGNGMVKDIDDPFVDEGFHKPRIVK